MVGVGDYEPSLIGVTQSVTVPLSVNNTKHTLVRLVKPGAGGILKKASFALRILGPMRIRQGGAQVSALELDAGSALKSMFLTTGMRWRVDVRDEKTNFLSVMVASGQVTFLLEITRISDCDTDDLPTVILDGTK